MGDPAAWIEQVELSVRNSTHDVLEANHEKDFKSWVAFPAEEAAHLVIHVMRVDY